MAQVSKSRPVHDVVVIRRGWRVGARLLDLVRRWHDESRPVVAVLHDLDMVRRTFPQTLLIAREPVAWGKTAEVLTPENMSKARRMCEAFDENAHECAA